MLTSLLACPSCHASLKLSSNIAGKKLRCPRCGTVFSPQAGATVHPQEYVLEDLSVEKLVHLCVLAVQKHLVGREEVLTAMRTWAASRRRPLQQVLLEDMKLRIEDAEALGQEVQQLMQKNVHDAGTTITCLPGQNPLFIELMEICDPPPTVAVPGPEEDKSQVVLQATSSWAPDPGQANRDCDPSVSSSSVQLGEKWLSSPPSLPGYEAIKLLGHGGMGVVYEARQLALDRRVAIKMILADEYVGVQKVARFRTEAQAIARLRHGNIVQIYEVGEHNGRPYFSMELVEGSSLKQRLSGRPMPPVPAARLLLKVAKAVHYAHQQGVVHRDLKPQNILLNEEREPKIADFGLAKLLDAEPGLTRTGMMLGTPSYMAPEQARGEVYLVCPATDVYALGAILYEMLTGQPPYTGRSSIEILNRVKTGRPLLPSKLQPGVSRELEAICLKCMDRQPRDRYATALELVNDLRRFLKGMSVRAPSIGLVVADARTELDKESPDLQETRLLTIKGEAEMMRRAEALARRLGVPLEVLVVRGLRSILFLLGEQ